MLIEDAEKKTKEHLDNVTKESKKTDELLIVKRQKVESSAR